MGLESDVQGHLCEKGVQLGMKEREGRQSSSTSQPVRLELYSLVAVYLPWLILDPKEEAWRPKSTERRKGGSMVRGGR